MQYKFNTCFKIFYCTQVSFHKRLLSFSRIFLFCQTHEHEPVDPPQYCDDAYLWFAQLEVFFAAHNVPSERQLSLLYWGPPNCLARTIKKLITDPKLDTTYDSLKEEVLKRNMQSSQSIFTLWMEDENLGDMTLTQFLRRLMELSD